MSLNEQKPQPLEEIDLCVTMKCNLSCVFCSVKANEFGGPDLSLSQIGNFIDQAVDLGLKQLHLTGGEPGLRNDLEQIIEYAAKRGIHTRIITNGTLLSKLRLRNLKNAGLKHIMISIDALEKTHDAMRGKSGTWIKAMECVKDSLELGYQTRISSVAFRSNLQEIPELMKIAAQEGVHIYSIFLGSPLGRAYEMKDQVISALEWKRFLEELQTKIGKDDYGDTMKIIVEQGFQWQNSKISISTEMKGRGCGCSTLLSDYSYLFVKSEGSVYQCVFFLHDGEAIGSLKQNSISEILEKAKKEKLYKSFTLAGDECISCPELNQCLGACRAYSYLYTQNWHKRDPRCRFDNFTRPEFYPICPIAKLNLRTGILSGSSEDAIREIL